MHKKEKYINKSMYSIQGLSTVANSLPSSVSKILKKGGHNYSTIINNWSELVGKEISKLCYPKSIKTNKELEKGTIILNVIHGSEIEVEYSKKNIIDKINAFFGYEFVKQVKLILIDKKVKANINDSYSNLKHKKMGKKINEIENINLKKKLNNLLKEYEGKNS